ncbi:carboxymuconolactone decarboxylase [Dactylonectria estremocensis]|uniref:Carboxymuconolactone decarboxylase n=1 Tax=Dactylonectria estremocensis TaxID=1079267 RepID=A0A9P9ENM3_9HYPO|nr:carboxymuconolactone decarboxylase [Dactylonectria estremocensis]
MAQPSEKLLLGAQMTRQFLGQDLLDQIQASSRDDLASRVGTEYIAEVCFSSYARPGLEFKERSLMNMAMMIALNRTPELRIHIRAALHNGLSETQIVEACRHAMIYCGVPAGREALAVASEVFSNAKEPKARDIKLS